MKRVKFLSNMVNDLRRSHAQKNKLENIKISRALLLGTHSVYSIPNLHCQVSQLRYKYNIYKNYI
jgi:hypothetical protein